MNNSISDLEYSKFVEEDTDTTAIYIQFEDEDASGALPFTKNTRRYSAFITRADDTVAIRVVLGAV